MAGAAHDITAYKDGMVILATAAIAIPLLQRVRISPVLGYLLTGMLLGPHMLGALTKFFPAAEWFTVSNPENLALVGELGVAFLLFIIGLELAPQRLWIMRRLVFGMGSLQIVLSALVLAIVAASLGQGAAAALIIGSSLALSSTAIVVELLSQQNRLSLGTGRTSFSILLMQDLAVIPLLMLVPALAPGNDGALWLSIAQAVAQAMLAIGIIVVVGYLVLRPLFRLVANTESGDLFVAAVLLVAAGSGIVTAAAGLSMALGAFVAGLLLAETEFRRAIEATIEPVKGLLLGCFFFTVGAGLDLSVIINNPGSVLLGLLALLVLKGVIVAGVVWAYGFSGVVAGRTAALLGPGGEFAFIVLGLAAASKIIEPDVTAYVLALTSLSMALIPLLDRGAQALFPIPANVPSDPALTALPEPQESVTAMVIGYGRVGALVSDMLNVHNVTHVITEKRPDLVSEGRKDSRPIYYGDALNTSFLQRCGLARAKAVIITIHDWEATDDIVSTIRGLSPTITIVARARDADHARYLYEIGASDAVPETIEASLQLSEAALVDLGVPTGPVIASIHEKRDEFRAALQSAAGKAGRTQSHGVRPKSRDPAAG
ncbi:MAG: potassium transporter TrkA [Hyphomicrobium sp. 32-62-53]|nr:MAG: potassium transporter TrkA [Hyphomicrobium sp. 12-62-95]OYX99521.1 MAG: potassium transporter TrkA [Hyphomicrobium sp. 32-62-53]